MGIEAAEKNSETMTKAVTTVSPRRLAHVVFRTSRYQEMAQWYKMVLSAHTSFSNAFLTFLRYDEEHHRIALLYTPGLADQDVTGPGMHHVAFTFDTLEQLLGCYTRLRDAGISPVFKVNHGPTTSLYYEDPDRNQIELQVDNFDDIDDATAFFYSDEFAENAVGVEFDPEELIRRMNAGEPEATLKKRPNAGPKTAADIKLR